MKEKSLDTSKSSNMFFFRRSSEPETYREPWRATKKSFESFDKDGYWYTGNIRPDIIVSITFNKLT